jgi:branched-chain amino acid transport system substrate-binding protein
MRVTPPGRLAARELAAREGRCLFGGLDTPSRSPSLRSPTAKVPFMGVWAWHAHHANGAAENYVFRVSAVDDLVDVALVDYAAKHASKARLILINNP